MSEIQMIKGDCLEEMKNIKDKSIDLILCDLPYGTTTTFTKKSSWDNIIPFEPLWEHYERIIKDNGVICLFACQPFTSKLIMSNLPLYKYNWTWVKKSCPTGFLNSHFQPLKTVEDICIFSKAPAAYSPKGSINYFPIMGEGKPYERVQNAHKATAISKARKYTGKVSKSNGERYPKNVLEFSRDREGYHPTQKPVKLLEYLIKTYTKEGWTVLDNCSGSFSTAVACYNLNRNFIGIEKDDKFFATGMNRISNLRIGTLF